MFNTLFNTVFNNALLFLKCNVYAQYKFKPHWAELGITVNHQT